VGRPCSAQCCAIDVEVSCHRCGEQVACTAPAEFGRQCAQTCAIDVAWSFLQLLHMLRALLVCILYVGVRSRCSLGLLRNHDGGYCSGCLSRLHVCVTLVLRVHCSCRNAA
jgi:hypothetical protein